MQVQFELPPLRSLLLRGYHLVSLPLPTWMLPFGRFPLHIGVPQILSAAGSPIRESPDRSLHAATRSISQLATPFFSAQAKPSFRWLIMSNLLGTHTRLTFEAYARCSSRSFHCAVNDHCTLRFPALSWEAASITQLGSQSTFICLPVRSTFVY
jgi:hypothetical protein